MKRVISLLLVVALSFAAFSCANEKTIDGVTYETYGLANEGDVKNENIQYELVWGNVVWSIVLVEFVVPPIYFIGFSLYEPVGKKDPNAIKGQAYKH